MVANRRSTGDLRLRRWHRPLTALALALALAACDGGSSADPTPTPAPGTTAAFTSGVASGDVRPIGAVLWTRAEGGDRLAIEVATDEAFSSIVQTLHAETSAARDYTVKANVAGLTPDTRYYYRFRAGGAVSPTGTFVTAPQPNAAKKIRFVFAGDSDGSRREDGSPAFNEFEVLDAAAAEDPAFFMYFGDTIYGDRAPAATSVDAYRAKYRQNRGYRALADLLAATSMITTWDDHEVTNDFDGTTVDRALLRAGRQAFREYMPVDDSRGDEALYNSFRWGADIDIIVLDERSYRSGSVEDACKIDGQDDLLPSAGAPETPPQLRGFRGFIGLPPDAASGCIEAIRDPARTLLGEEQKAYLFDRLLHADATWKIVVNEVPIQPLLVLPYDRWEGYAAERREVLQFLRDNQIKNVVFLTTDFHANIFGPVRMDPFADAEPLAYEAVVGPIAVETLEQDIVGVAGEAGAGVLGGFLTGVVGVDCAELDAYAYGLVEVDPEAGTLTVTAKDASGRELCKKTLKAA